MSSYICAACKAFQLDTSNGYITGCRHHAPDIEPSKLTEDQKAWIKHIRERGYYVAIPRW